MGREGRPSREIRLPAKFRDDEVELPQKKQPKLYCSCRQPYEKGTFMIACDASKKSSGCLEWCHGACVGISREEAKKIKQYTCPPCQAEGGLLPQPDCAEFANERGKGGPQSKRARSSRGGEKQENGSTAGTLAMDVGAPPVVYGAKEEDQIAGENTADSSNSLPGTRPIHRSPTQSQQVEDRPSTPATTDEIAFPPEMGIQESGDEQGNQVIGSQGCGMAADIAPEATGPQQADLGFGTGGVQSAKLVATVPLQSDTTDQEPAQAAQPPSSSARAKLAVKRRAEDVLPRASSLRRSESAGGSIRVAVGAEPLSSDVEMCPLTTTTAPGAGSDITMMPTRVNGAAMEEGSEGPQVLDVQDRVVEDTSGALQAVRPQSETAKDPPDEELQTGKFNGVAKDSAPEGAQQIPKPQPAENGPESNAPVGQSSSADAVKGSESSGEGARGGTSVEAEGLERTPSEVAIPKEPEGLQTISDVSRRNETEGLQTKAMEGALKRSDSRSEPRGFKAEWDSPKSEGKEMHGSPSGRVATSTCSHAGCNKEARAGQWYCSDDCGKAAERETLAKKRLRDATSGASANKRRVRELGRSTSAVRDASGPAARVATPAAAARLADSPKGEMGMRQKLRDSLAAALALVALAPRRTDLLQSELSLPKEGVSAPSDAGAPLQPSPDAVEATAASAAVAGPSQTGGPAPDQAAVLGGPLASEAATEAQAEALAVSTQGSDSTALAPPISDAAELPVASGMEGGGISQAEREELEHRAAEVAAQVEGEMHSAFGGASKKYRERARSLLFNLKDPNNPELRQRVMSGEISPQQLSQMTADQLASKELAEWRTAKAELHAQQVVLTDADVNLWRVVKKTHKGEVEVVERQDDMAAVSDAAITGGLRAPRVSPAQDVRKEGGGEKGKSEEPLKDLPDSGAKKGPIEPRGKKPAKEERNIAKEKVVGREGEAERERDEIVRKGKDAPDGGTAEPMEVAASSEPEATENDAEKAELPPIMSLDEYMEARNGKDGGRDSPGGSGGEGDELEADELSYSPIQSPAREADATARPSPARPQAAGAEEGRRSAALLWEGRLQVGSAGQCGVRMLYRSGEKLPVSDCMRGVVEVKGRVRLSEMDRFLNDLRVSRSRAVMGVSFVAKSGRDRASLQEVAEQYRTSERVGFVELRAGGELYLLPAGDMAAELMHRHGHSTVVDEMGDKDVQGEVLVGALIRRRARMSSSTGPSPGPSRSPVPSRKVSSSIVKTSERRTEPSKRSYDGPPGFEGHVIPTSAAPAAAEPAAAAAAAAALGPAAQLLNRAADRDPRKRQVLPQFDPSKTQPPPSMAMPVDLERPFAPPPGHSLPQCGPPLPPTQPSIAPPAPWRPGVSGHAPQQSAFNMNAQPGQILQEPPRQALQRPQTDADDLPEFQFDGPEVPLAPRVHGAPMHAQQNQMQQLPPPRPALDRLPRNAAGLVNDAVPPGFGAPGGAPPQPMRPQFRAHTGHTYISQVPENHVLGAPLLPSLPRSLTPTPPPPRPAWQDGSSSNNVRQQVSANDSSVGHIRNNQPAPGPPSWTPSGQGLPQSHYGGSKLPHQPQGASWERPPQLSRVPVAPPVRYDGGSYRPHQARNAPTYVPDRDRWPPLPKGRDYSKEK